MTALVPAECGGMTSFLPQTPFRRECCGCGQLATRLCDYRVRGGLPCDLLICDKCGNTPGPHDDYCPHHDRVWKDRQKLRAAAQGATV